MAVVIVPPDLTSITAAPLKLTVSPAAKLSDPPSVIVWYVEIRTLRPLRRPFSPPSPLAPDPRMSNCRHQGRANQP